MTTMQQGGLVPEFTIGDRMRKARETMGMEQGPFADLIGVSRGSVSNYERGTIGRYRPIVVKAWAMATGVSQEWLETGVIPAGPTGPDGGSSKDERAERLAALAASKRSDSLTGRYSHAA